MTYNTFHFHKIRLWAQDFYDVLIDISAKSTIFSLKLRVNNPIVLVDS